MYVDAKKNELFLSQESCENEESMGALENFENA